MRPLLLTLVLLVLSAHALAGSDYVVPVTTTTIGAQPVDATLTAVAAATCEVDRILYCSGTDAITSGTLTAAGRALLDDANATAQLATLGAGALCTGNDASDVPYTPTVVTDWSGSVDPGATNDALDQLASRTTTLESAGGGAGPYDWADPTYEVAGDQLTTVNPASWSDAFTVFGSGTTTCATVFETRLLRVNGGFESNCTTAHGTTTRTDGLLTPVGSGDFTVVLRVGWRRSAATLFENSINLQNAVVFVDGTTTAANWYGINAYYINTGDLSLLTLLMSTTNGGGWDTMQTYGNSYSLTPAMLLWDVAFVRAGTTLKVYMGPARGQMLPFGAALFTVSTGVGRIGLRMRSEQTTPDYTVGTIYAYRASLTEVP